MHNNKKYKKGVITLLGLFLVSLVGGMISASAELNTNDQERVNTIITSKDCMASFIDLPELYSDVIISGKKNARATFEKAFVARSHKACRLQP